MLLGLDWVISKAVILIALSEIIIPRDRATLEGFPSLIPILIRSITWSTLQFLAIGIILQSLYGSSILRYLRKLWHYLTVLTPVNNSIIIHHTLMKLIVTIIRCDTLLISVLTCAPFEIVFVNSYVILVQSVYRGPHQRVCFLLKPTFSPLFLNKIFLLVDRRTIFLWPTDNWVGSEFVAKVTSAVSGASTIFNVDVSVLGLGCPPYWAMWIFVWVLFSCDLSWWSKDVFAKERQS